MTRISTLTMTATVLLSLAACRGKPAAAPAAAPTPEPSAPAASTPPQASAPATAAPAPIADLYALDQRQPVPLQPMMAWHQKENMQAHLVAIQRITDGVARKDWDAVANAAAAIGSSPQMQQMCEHMGAGAPGFTERALDFHRRADAIGQAARTHDAKAVLQATAHTLEACTGCHAAYRQEVVDARTWMQRTGEAHGPAMPAMPHGGP